MRYRIINDHAVSNVAIAETGGVPAARQFTLGKLPDCVAVDQVVGTSDTREHGNEHRNLLHARLRLVAVRLVGFPVGLAPGRGMSEVGFTLPSNRSASLVFSGMWMVSPLCGIAFTL